jgi:ATP-binding cassette subfamily B protein
MARPDAPAGAERPGTQAQGWIERLRTLRHLGRLFAQIWQTSRTLTLLSLVLRLIRALQPVAMLYVGKLIIDEVVRQTGIAPPGPGIADWLDSGRLTPLVWLLGIEFALVFAGDVIGRATSLVDSVLAELHSNRISTELMEHAARLDLRHFESADYQDRLERARRQAAGRSNLLSQIFGQAQDLITIVTLAIGLFVYAPWLILLLTLSLVPAVIGEARFNRQGYAISRGRTPERRQLEYLRHVGAHVDTAKEIKLFDLGGFLVGRFRTLAAQIFLENRDFQTRRAIWGALLAAIATITYYGAYAYIVWRTVSGEFSIGDLTFLSGSFLNLNRLLQGLLIGLTQIAGQTLYLDDLFSFFEIEPTILDPVEPKPFPVPIRQGVRFENVGFRYPETDRWAVRNLSFEIRAGETLALVGENGAGKTTIVKLLTRLYDPDEGRITIDGIDLREIGLSDLRAHMGVIFQDFIRYSLTAAENIGIGRAEAMDDRARIEAAAQRSLAGEVIDKLPNGYEQMLGRMFSRGRDLSGGEWQKIAIARAYMRDAQLMVLDEPTAALDALSEAAVFSRFRGLAEGRTAMLISHRFSTVRMADRILVLTHGEIVEQGSHEELMAKGGLYREMFEIQAAGYR